MRILFLVVALLACFVGLVAVRLKHRIKNQALRTTMLVTGALGLYAMAGDELYRVTSEFSAWNALAGINVLVPLGWFMGGSFILLLAVVNAKNTRPEPK